VSILYRLINRLPLPQQTLIRWQESMIDRSYSRQIRAAQESKDRDEVEMLRGARQFELQMLQEESDLLASRQLLRKARRLRVPVPLMSLPDGTSSPDWEKADTQGTWHLSDSAYATLREAIRKEESYRRDQRVRWFGYLAAVLTALTGIIGALTGLLAVYRK
jgi:hypothetical protein